MMKVVENSNSFDSLKSITLTFFKAQSAENFFKALRPPDLIDNRYLNPSELSLTLLKLFECHSIISDLR